LDLHIWGPPGKPHGHEMEGVARAPKDTENKFCWIPPRQILGLLHRIFTLETSWLMKTRVWPKDQGGAPRRSCDKAFFASCNLLCRAKRGYSYAGSTSSIPLLEGTIRLTLSVGRVSSMQRIGEGIELGISAEMWWPWREHR